MNRLVVISLFIISFLHGYPQYFGGSDDGFFQISSVQAPLNDQEFYCSGGIDDGFSMLKLENLSLNNQVFYLSGGINDGFSVLNTGLTNICDPSVYVSGGIGDGFVLLKSGNTNICNQSIYASGGMGDGFYTLGFAGPINYSPAWLGGISDGFSSLYSPMLALAPTFFCLGGENDGAFSLHMPASYFGKGIWLGTASSSWNNPANWSINYVPDLTVNVLIGAGRSYYPLIQSGNLTIDNASGEYFCKSLTISEGGTLINKSNLYLHGDMTVSGIYQGDGSNNNELQIYSGGNLAIEPPGQVLVGHP